MWVVISWVLPVFILNDLKDISLCTCSAGYKLWSCSLHLCISWYYHHIKYAAHTSSLLQFYAFIYVRHLQVHLLSFTYYI
jgi:hypothetical protein